MRRLALALAVVCVAGPAGCGGGAHHGGTTDSDEPGAADDAGATVPRQNPQAGEDARLDKPPAAPAPDGPAPALDGARPSDGPPATAGSDGPKLPPPDPGTGARFVAVGYGARRVWSDDGKTWTESPLLTNPPWANGATLKPVDGDNEWLVRGVCYGNGTWVAVGGLDTKGMSLTSTDGHTWEAMSNTPGDTCAYGNGVFTTGRRVSPDGKTWRNVVKPPKATRDMVFGMGRFVAVGDQGGGNVSYSLDGSNWVELPIGYAGANDSDRRGYYRVVFGNGHFYAMKSCCGRTDYKFFEWDGRSDTSFTEVPLSSIATTQVDGLVYGGGHLVIYGPNNLFDRPDGSTTWTHIMVKRLTRPDGTYEDRPLNNATYYGGFFVATNASTPDLMNYTLSTFTNMLWAGKQPGLNRIAVRQ